MLSKALVLIAMVTPSHGQRFQRHQRASEPNEQHGVKAAILPLQALASMIIAANPSSAYTGLPSRGSPHRQGRSLSVNMGQGQITVDVYSDIA